MAEDNVIKKANTPAMYTTEHLKNLKKCIKDPVFFMENFVWVQHPTKGKVPLNLYHYQREMVESINSCKYSILLTARQMGKCVSFNSPITLKSPEGREIKLPIGVFYEWQKFKKIAIEILKENNY